jgi:hypothetical protein
LAPQAGRNIKRIVVAFEAGRDGFWLARWLRARDLEAYVIHPTSIAVSREHRRAKTDRLDTELLVRVFLGWLRGEKRRCSMVAIPTIAEEDARRPNRERQNLVTEQTRIINQIKAIFSRFGIRPLRPTKRKLAEGLEDLRTSFTAATSLPVWSHNHWRFTYGRVYICGVMARGHHCGLARAFAVNPSRLPARPSGRCNRSRRANKRHSASSGGCVRAQFAVNAKGAALKATRQPIDTSTAAGKCFLDMLGVFAEFETNLRKERQLEEAIAKAKQAGVYKGRPASIDPAQVRELKAQGVGPSEIARRLGIGRASVYRALDETAA